MKRRTFIRSAVTAAAVIALPRHEALAGLYRPVGRHARPYADLNPLIAAALSAPRPSEKTLP